MPFCYCALRRASALQPARRMSECDLGYPVMVALQCSLQRRGAGAAPRTTRPPRRQRWSTAAHRMQSRTCTLMLTTKMTTDAPDLAVPRKPCAIARFVILFFHLSFQFNLKSDFVPLELNPRSSFAPAWRPIVNGRTNRSAAVWSCRGPTRKSSFETIKVGRIGAMCCQISGRYAPRCSTCPFHLLKIIILEG